MARLRRHDLPASGAYHLTMRGVDGCDLFIDDQDRHSFLRFLRLATIRANWRLFAFCLMRNHFHLVVLGELENISRGMHTLAFRHAQTFNRRHTRRGHLYSDRFYARVIRNDEHLTTACTYVLDNAERAGVRDWPWRGGELFDRSTDDADARDRELRSQALACTGDSAGAHEQIGDASPPRPFKRR